MNEDYYRFDGDEDVIIGRGNAYKQIVHDNKNEHRIILREIEEIHKLDEEEEWAWKCWCELQEYQKRYAIPILMQMSFYEFVNTFFN